MLMSWALSELLNKARKRRDTVAPAFGSVGSRLALFQDVDHSLHVVVVGDFAEGDVAVGRAQQAEVAHFVVGAVGIEAAKLVVVIFHHLANVFDTLVGRVDAAAGGLDVVTGNAGENVARLADGTDFDSQPAANDVEQGGRGNAVEGAGVEYDAQQRLTVDVAALHRAFEQVLHDRTGFSAGGFAVGDRVAAAGGDFVDLGEILLTLGRIVYAGGDQGGFGEGKVGGVTASHVLEQADFVGGHGEFAVAGLEAGHLVEHREGVDAEHGLVGGGG